MVRSLRSVWPFIAAAVFGICAHSAVAADTDGCARFTWDVSHELAVMKQTPQAIVAATKPGFKAPLLKLDKLYELKLSPQTNVTYVAKPERPTTHDNAQGGLIRLRVEKAGIYRISINSRHWIDVVDGDHFVKSKDFQGSRGCERPHKIVKFDLPAGNDFVLQFSGSTEPSVVLAITAEDDYPSTTKTGRGSALRYTPFL